MKIEFRGKSYY